MDDFLRLSADRQRRVYDEAQSRINLPAASLEKDFWVCWTLRELFSLQGWQGHLAFKGGTSLSKGWRLIERFSEDIDVVIGRDFLGFGGLEDPGMGMSRKKRTAILERLKEACRKHIHDRLKPALEQRFLQVLPSGLDWSLTVANVDEDPEGQTLLFRYPTVHAIASSYIRPMVKIELGARSDTEPSERPKIQAYVAEIIPDMFSSAPISIHTVSPRRTFWEKAMLLHEENSRPSGKPPKYRLSRHYYDLWCLIRKGIAAEALADTTLFRQVLIHRNVFFRQSWVEYEALLPAGLRLTPPADGLAAWYHDYESMKRGMFFAEPPSFDDILAGVREFELVLARERVRNEYKA